MRFAELNVVKTQFEEAAFTARERIHCLADKSREPSSNTYRFSAAMIYKMVGQLADFAPKYRGLSAITLDNDALEAAGTISFRSTASDGDSLWFMNPAYLDAFSQLGGFVMNANEEVDLDKELFVNHGWASMTLFRSQLDTKATYYSYVKMNEGKDNLWSGDVLIFDEQYELIGVIRGVAVCLQRSASSCKIRLLMLTLMVSIAPRGPKTVDGIYHQVCQQKGVRHSSHVPAVGADSNHGGNEESAREASGQG